MAVGWDKHKIDGLPAKYIFNMSQVLLEMYEQSGIQSGNKAG